MSPGLGRVGFVSQRTDVSRARCGATRVHSAGIVHSSAFVRAAVTSASCCLALALGGCVDWLEVDEGEEPVYTLPVGEPLVLPSEPALIDAPGPLVPRTPGLRVPLAGYWTRVRLDAHDLLFPYTWASLLWAEEVGPPGASALRVLFRVEGSTAQGDDPSEVGATRVAGIKAVVPITLPPGTDASVLRDGFELTAKALEGATVAVRTSSQDLWLVTPTRLRFDRVDPGLLMGSLEGEARRGAKGQRARSFVAAFIALRAPDDERGGSVPSELVVPPDSGGPGAP